jgi:ABC-2 type transport system ATP-binding protein
VALSVAGESRAALAPILADRSLVARADDQNRFYEINLATGADPQRLLRRVMETGAVIQRFELVQPSLHQIFLEKVGATGVEEGMQGHG